MTITRVLVAVDFGAASLAALDYARDCTLQLGGTLTALHVVDEAAPAAGSGDSTASEAETRAKSTLMQALTASPKAIAARVVVRQSPRPAEAILEYARQSGTELIIMGMNGTGGPDFFMGSVAQQVVRHAPCPVLTLRHEPRRLPAGAIGGTL